MTTSTAFGAKKTPAKGESIYPTKKSKYYDGSDDDDEHNIENILAYRTIQRYEYLIQWESNHRADLWVPEEQLSKEALKDAKKLRNEVEKYGAYPGNTKVPAKDVSGPPLDDDDGYYTIEKILAYRIITSYDYLIEWESPTCCDSWIPEENMSEGALDDAKQFRNEVEKNGFFPAPK